MTWISTVPPADGGEALARALAMQRTLYPAMYGEPKPPRDDGSQAESIVASHSLIPDALYHAFATFGALMSPDLPLERRQPVMSATMVSVTNRCRY
jgi:hypothetical protein